jgi:hypothetical protein
VSLAHLKIGELSRGGKLRGEKASEAHDHAHDGVMSCIEALVSKVARMQRSGIRGPDHSHYPDFALLHPGYIRTFKGARPREGHTDASLWLAATSLPSQA